MFMRRTGAEVLPEQFTIRFESCGALSEETRVFRIEVASLSGKTRRR